MFKSDKNIILVGCHTRVHKRFGLTIFHRNHDNSYNGRQENRKNVQIIDSVHQGDFY